MVPIVVTLVQNSNIPVATKAAALTWLFDVEVVHLVPYSDVEKIRIYNLRVKHMFEPIKLCKIDDIARSCDTHIARFITLEPRLSRRLSRQITARLFLALHKRN